LSANVKRNLRERLERAMKTGNVVDRRIEATPEQYEDAHGRSGMHHFGPPRGWSAGTAFFGDPPRGQSALDKLFTEGQRG
jgi:hypothetical protein